MLIYSENRLVPTDVNMLVIRAKNNNGYFYIHRALYDQAVIIHDIYGDEPMMLVEALTGKSESRADADRVLSELPPPLNIFGPYLLLVKDGLTELEDMVGAIHVMSGPLHLRNMLKIPFEMRNTMPSFSLSIKDEYKLAWDRFFQTALPYTNDMFHSPVVTPMNGVQTTTVVNDMPSHVEEEKELTGYEDQGIDADVLAFLMGDDDPFAELDELDDTEDTAAVEESSVTPTPVTPSPVVQEPIPEPEPEPEPKKLSGVDALINLA